MTNDLFRDYLDGKIRCPRQARAEHRKRIEQRIERFSKIINDALPRFVEAFKQFREAVNAVAESMRTAGLIATPPPADLRERALWAKQNRGHGPAVDPLRTRGHTNHYRRKG